MSKAAAGVRTVGANDVLIGFLKSVENDALVGRDSKTGLNYAYPSPEGGTMTIGFGHKLKKGESYPDGLTDEQVLELLDADIEEARRKVAKKVPEYYSLPSDIQDMLTEIEFNVKGGIDSYPKFKKAAVEQDYATMRKEHLRYYTDKDGKKKPLTRRNELFEQTFFNK